MSFIVSGIPMVSIPRPQHVVPFLAPWLEGINPVTNLQWQRGVEPLIGQGARYGLLEPDHRGDHRVRQLGDLKDVLDTLGRDNVPEDWDERNVLEMEIVGLGTLAVFQWLPRMSQAGFDRDHQPVVSVSWYHAKGWTLAQGGLFLLTDAQWEWSAQGGVCWEFSTITGKLTDPKKGRKLVHCSIGTRKHQATVDVNNPKYADGPFGLRHKTGNVWEWVEKNPDKERPYGLRGGCWSNDYPEILRTDRRYNPNPACRRVTFGFRVGAPGR